MVRRLFIIALTLVACAALDQNQEAHDLSLSEVILEKVRHTDRISSNHYSSMVVDSSGHVYVSCFYKDPKDGRDRHIYRQTGR